MRRFLLLLAGALAATGAPAAAPDKGRPSEAAAGEFSVRVTENTRSRTALVTFGPEPLSPLESAPGGGGILQMRLEVNGKGPDAALRIAGMTGDLLAVDEHGVPVQVRSVYLNGAGPGGAAFTVAGLTRSAAGQELRVLAGELVVYPVARRVRVEIPWPKEKETPTATAQGVKATLLQATRQGNLLRIRLRVEVPDGSLGADEPWNWGDPPIRLDDAAGKTLVVGDTSFQPAPGGESYREYQVDYRSVHGTPAKVVFEVLARTGTPQNVPFRFTGLRLPSFDASEEPAGATRNPYFDPTSKSALVSTVLVRGEPATDGVVLCGLSRQEAASRWGPWRWMEMATDELGRAVLESVQPGRYRISRQWRPSRREGFPAPPPPSQWLNGRMEVEVPRGRTVLLPPLELR